MTTVKKKRGRPFGFNKPTLFHARNATLRGIATAINVVVDGFERVYGSTNEVDLDGMFSINPAEQIDELKLMVRTSIAIPPNKKFESFDVRTKCGMRFLVIPLLETDSEECGE